jgi:hypothetical protein
VLFYYKVGKGEAIGLDLPSKRFYRAFYGNSSLPFLFPPQVKFLKTKEGCAMIQMGDNIAVERCLQNLNNVTIGTDGRLQLGFSKQAFLSDVTNPYILPDKTASFKDFTGSKNNR